MSMRIWTYQSLMQCWGKCQCTGTLENIWHFLAKLNMCLSMHPSNWALGHLSQSNENLYLYKTLCVSVPTSLIYKSQNQPSGRRAQMPFKGDWLHKLWYIHTTESHSGWKRTNCGYKQQLDWISWELHEELHELHKVRYNKFLEFIREGK